MDEKRKEQDNDASLQEELRRESTEGADAIGDIAENRNVSGSSTWTTEPEKEKTDRGDR